MVRERMWEPQHAYAAFFWNREHPDRFSIRDVAGLIKSEFGRHYSKSSVSNMVADVEQALKSGNEQAKQDYEKVKLELTTGKKYFWRYDADGKVDSPYEVVKSVAERIYGRGNYYPDWFLDQLNVAERFWQFVGKKNPKDWTEQDYNKYIGTVGAGSKYTHTIAIRQFGQQIKDIDDLTRGLKPAPRKPKLLKLPDFPQLYQKIVAKAVEIARPEEREQIEFILQVKPRIGVRTGARETGKGLWGTKVGGEWKNKRGKNASFVQVVGNNFIWHLLEKKDEEWDINFYNAETKKRIIDYVSKKQAGEWLIEISISRVSRILKEACLALGIGQFRKDDAGNIVKDKLNRPIIDNALRLHDLRKVYISFLVRSGIRLEQAITLNVGWRDIGTAAKYYLEFQELAEELQKAKERFAALFGEKGEGGALPEAKHEHESGEDDDEEEGEE
ncbi:hypothetical protein Ngar_c15770 [Candidatus Nitrososphaera gargensis Ga9.2]|uniref:Integrase family protein n=1 Tax=Nitrososphaera gargensis (strain Ga9.2) TaxID=1237085 RepID=K0IFC3_NITGG|nr:hypothetical protein [Candidatus Nitrososphaera gargensis]AFU58510.1 hypothetical protein Ngar_c15770 [Candidatus Nitrososphaera gargensis Ga9.2]